MAYMIFKPQGKPGGKSLVADDKLDPARDIMARAQQGNLQLLLPVDHAVAPKVEAGVPIEPIAVSDPAIGEWMGLDIGPATVSAYTQALKDAKTVVWNGPVGVFENDAFARGTETIARAIADSKAFSIAGGGDTVAAINKFGIADKVSYISTAGGAFLEFLEGKPLPGVAALRRYAQTLAR